MTSETYTKHNTETGLDWLRNELKEFQYVHFTPLGSHYDKLELANAIVTLRSSIYEILDSDIVNQSHSIRKLVLKTNIVNSSITVSEPPIIDVFAVGITRDRAIQYFIEDIHIPFLAAPSLGDEGGKCHIKMIGNCVGMLSSLKEDMLLRSIPPSLPGHCETAIYNYTRAYRADNAPGSELLCFMFMSDIYKRLHQSTIDSLDDEGERYLWNIADNTRL